MPKRGQAIIWPNEETVHWRIYVSPGINNLIQKVRNSIALLWRHNGRGSVSNHQPHDCLLNRSCRCKSKKTSKIRVTGLCAWNSPVIGEFHAQKTSNAENVSIWWHHHGVRLFCTYRYVANMRKTIMNDICINMHSWLLLAWWDYVQSALKHEGLH